jgi:hypothetical protein
MYMLGNNCIYWFHCNLEINVDAACTDNGPADQCNDLKSNCSIVSGAYKCTCNDEYYNKDGTYGLKP